MKIADEIKQRQAEIEPLDIEKRQQFMISIIAGQYDRAMLYVTTIIAGSYAAFFTAWSGVQGDLPQFERFFSLILMLLSLMVFLGWEIFKMIKRAYLVQDEIEVAQALHHDFMRLLPEVQEKERSTICLIKRYGPEFWC